MIGEIVSIIIGKINFHDHKLVQLMTNNSRNSISLPPRSNAKHVFKKDHEDLPSFTIQCQIYSDHGLTKSRGPGQ